MSTGGISAVILAGGKGTRIQHLNPDSPKPMIACCGQPFLYWVTAYFAKAGLRRFIYSTGYKGEQIGRWCTDSTMPGVERTACHEAAPLGTGGGLINCLHLCGEWVLVANGDSLCIADVAPLLSLTPDPALSGGVVGIYQSDTARYGSLNADERGLLTSFREKTPGAGYINAGIYLFRSKELRRFPQGVPLSIEHDIFPCLLAQNAKFAAVLLKEAPFIDIGTPETLRQASTFINTHRSYFQ